MANVSVMTASRALRDSSLLAPDTHRRVLEACEKVGYRLNAGARATRERRFRQIACVILRIGGDDRPAWPVSYSYVNTLADELANRGYSLVLQPFRLAPDYSFIEPPRVFYESAVDGIIAIGSTSQVPAEVHESLVALGLPMAWLNSGQLKGALCFMSDERVNAKMLVDHLLELGHERIAYLGPTLGHYSGRDRYEGVVEALQQAGADTSFVMQVAGRGAVLLPHAYDELLTRTPRPTAVITFNFQVLQALLYRASARGLAVPRDLSVSCFASPWVADLELPPTFVEVPERQMAQKAVPIILDQINGKSRANRCYTLSGVFRKGYSTAPA